MSALRRPFRIETLGPTDDMHAGGARIEIVGRLDRIDTELSQIRGLMETLNGAEERALVRSEAQALWIGVEAIQQAIRNTKAEVAALHAKGIDGRQLNRATDELSAVVADTESATESILTSAEAIDAAAALLLRDLDGPQREIVAGMHEHATRIFEGCNFQDITGQRISKVVELLRFIEERISSMLLIWADSLDSSAGPSERTGDEALLNGPALAGDHDVVSQDEIDSLFP